MTTKISGSVEQGAGGWWVAQIGVTCIDAYVLRDATNEHALLGWDGVVGRYETEAAADAALASAIAEGEEIS